MTLLLVFLLGAACGSVVARAMNLSARAQRILMAAGLAGGIGALFQAPLAGALFGMEIMYSSSDIEYETVLPCFISSAVSYTIFAYFFGWGSLFTMPFDCVFNSGLRLLPYCVLALIVVFGVRFYISMFRKVEMTNVSTHTTMTYSIVNPHEANLREGKISIQSPIAQSLLGKKAGETVEVQGPAGKLTLKIESISLMDGF